MLANNKTETALSPPDPGQVSLATALATALPYPSLMVGTVEEATLPSELLVLGSLLTFAMSPWPRDARRRS